VLDKLSETGRQAALQEPRVHKGFLSAYETVADKIYNLIEPLVIQDGAQARDLYCTGHSLGGALAVLCAFDLGIRITNVIRQAAHVAVTTFGCPRVGNFSFQQRFQGVVHSSFRFVLASDIVPKLPPRFGEISKYNGYHHIGNTVLLTLDGNLLVNPGWIEEKMLHGTWSFKASRHFMTRYALGLVLFYGRLHLREDIGFWSVNISKMCYFAMKDMQNLDHELVRHAFGVVYQEGVTFAFDKIVFTTQSTQTSAEDFPDLLEQVVVEECDSGDDDDFVECERLLSQPI